MNTKAQWFAVHSQSGHENKIAESLKQRVSAMNLSDKIEEVLVPTQNKIVVQGGKKRAIKERLFPGYILVKMTLNDTTWQVVRSTEGVTGFVGIGNKPSPLPEEQIKGILAFMEIEAPKFEARFDLGDSVKIIDGPFTEFVGKVNEIDKEKGRLKVLVSIFGRETPVELDLVQVAPI